MRNVSSLYSSWLIRQYINFFVPLNFPLPHPANKSSSLTELGAAIQVDQKLQNELKHHDCLSRLSKSYCVFIISIIFTLIYYSLIALLIITIIFLFLGFTHSEPSSFLDLLKYIIIVIFFLWLELYTAILYKEFTKKILKDNYAKFAENYCVREVIYIETELNKIDTFRRVKGREWLKKRMQRLGKLTRLLGKTLSKNEPTNEQFYNVIAFYIEKKGKDLLGYKGDDLVALAELREEFHNHLTKYYLTEQHGLAFSYVISQCDDSELENSIRPRRKRRLYTKFLKPLFVFTWIFSFLLAIVAWFYPARLPLLIQNDFNTTLITILLILLLIIGAFAFGELKHYLKRIQAIGNFINSFIGIINGSK